MGIGDACNYLIDGGRQPKRSEFHGEFFKYFIETVIKGTEAIITPNRIYKI